MEKTLKLYRKHLLESIYHRELAGQILSDGLKEYRKKTGKSLRQLGSELGVSAVFLSDIEIKRRTISEKTALKLTNLK
jgi:predicted transcriptional regulator